jgi:hypothetical protein
MIHGVLASEAPALADFFDLWELFGYGPRPREVAP